MESPPTPIRIHAAGSLRNALRALTTAFTAATGAAFDVRHGPAGLLRERIEAGDRPDLFLSANLAHPARLAELGLARPPVVFARNKFVALARRGASITKASFMIRLLEPDVVIATSTPVNDPSGDYAWEVFAKMDELRPGALAILDAKAQRLVGGGEPANPSGQYDVLAEALRTGTVTVFLGYLTGIAAMAAKVEETKIVTIPPEINVVPRYGMAVLNGCGAAGLDFALFLMSVPGQALLAEAGFQPASG